VRRYYDEGYRWVVDADIDNFFDEVEHERLLARLRESIPDEEFLQLVRAWLTAPLKDGGRLIERARGLAPGAPARLLERCWDAERRLKLSGPARPELSLLVADLCAG